MTVTQQLLCIAPQDHEFAEAFKGQMPACNAAISHQSSGIDCALSGSTGILAVLHASRTVTVANVGDSRCFLGGMDDKGDTYSVPLSTDHTPALASEARRIHGCKVGLCDALDLFALACWADKASNVMC